MKVRIEKISFSTVFSLKILTFGSYHEIFFKKNVNFAILSVDYKRTI